MSDPATQAQRVRSDIAAVLSRLESRLRFLLVGALLTLVAIALILGIVVRGLQSRNADLDADIDELEAEAEVNESLVEQSTDAIVLLIGVLEENGINPPEIVIRPPDD